ncbi:hypothetical protein [Pseudomonas sp. MPB26]|uniref:hypothetical protein n=1 Tax=Pseudomonas sp. MPB26 TaxID=3388491 RepID=UPI0039848EC3
MLDKIASCQGHCNTQGAGQQSVEPDEINQRIKALINLIAQQKAQGVGGSQAGGGSHGTGKSPEEVELEALLSRQAAQVKQSPGAGGGQQTGSGSGGGQIQIPPPQ